MGLATLEGIPVFRWALTHHGKAKKVGLSCPEALDPIAKALAPGWGGKDVVGGGQDADLMGVHIAAE